MGPRRARPRVLGMAANPPIRSPKRRPNGSATHAARRQRLTPARALALATTLAVVLGGVLIGLSVAGSSSSTSRSIAGSAATTSLLAGISQHGSVLGRGDAPVRLAELRRPPVSGVGASHSGRFPRSSATTSAEAG